ncbi:CoxG family protein [Alicyclobacillus macrosporangiidus]|jgi:carbon monoxide dehydrogenase subunit G|uniref:Carbon monoxide dehydrogenase subunit G n=1 Tax=Alicyclobacillus macrosporangiidus TaxID=392015 RepID=A0A1I7G707_9BACL|nr:SRPBCC domain-containing protein [Alicyclobacillus macrosporangiidus]SFU44262.1 hypothetical protein SAMN05421543_10238 [Alicyclobacillus macrosporangiidus]
MQVSSEFEVKCPQEQVFAFVSTPERLAKCIPGCSQLTDLGEGNYGATLEVEVAFLKLKFDVTVRLTEVNAPSSLKAVVDGKPKALAGKLSGTVDLTVRAVDEQTTRIHYVLDQTITGKLGGIGQSVFRAKCEEMGSLFAENLKAALTHPQEALS